MGMSGTAGTTGSSERRGCGFADTLSAAMDRAGTVACVGLDPVVDAMPEAVRAEHWEAIAAVEAFCAGVVDAVCGVVGVMKVQSACFERYGHRGMASLEHVCGRAAGAGLVVVLDAKRGDIGISARHYAAAAVGMGAKAITVNGYLGPETIEPFLEAGLGVFVLVRTSNPGSDAVQALELKDGRSVAEMMAGHVRELGLRHLGACGLSDVGAVVGATKAAEGARLRAAMPEQFILVPGFGAQGGRVEDVIALARGAGGDRPSSRGVVVTASRSVTYPKMEGGERDWRAAVRRAAEGMVSDLRAVS